MLCSGDMGIEDLNQRKSHNAFGEFVEKPFGNNKSCGEVHEQKKVKLNSEAPLSFPSLPLPKQLLTTFFQHNRGGTLHFQLFLTTRSSTSPDPPPPVYILKVTSASNAKDEAEAVVTETTLVAEAQFLLRSRL